MFPMFPFGSGNHFPYTNFHELNLDWIISQMIDFLSKRQSAITDIDTHKDDAISAINTKEGQAINAVNTAKNNAVSSFQTSAQQIVDDVTATIPSDYSTLDFGAMQAENLIAGAYTSGIGIETIDSPVPNRVYRLQLTSKPDWFPSDYPLTGTIFYLMDITYNFSGTRTTYRYILDDMLRIRWRMWKQPYGTWSAWESYMSESVISFKVGEIITGSPTGTVMESPDLLPTNTLYRVQLTSQPDWIPDDIVMANYIRYVIKVEYPWGENPADTLIVMDETFNKLGFCTKQPTSTEFGAWLYYTANGLTIKVPVAQNTITLKDAVEQAYYLGNVRVELEDGDYTISDFTGLGMPIGHSIHIVGTSKTCIIAGSPSGLQYYSIFYAGAGDFILENVELRGSNIRYCVHDDPQADDSAVPACHIFKHCKMYIDNDNNSVWSNNQCLGGGMSLCTTVIIDSCIFEASTPSNTLGLVSYHNNANANAKGKIFVKNCYFMGNNGTFRASYYGASTLITDVLVFGCKMGIPVITTPETQDSNVQNFNIVTWGNVIGNEIKRVSQTVESVTISSGLDYFNLPHRNGKSLINAYPADWQNFQRTVRGIADQTHAYGIMLSATVSANTTTDFVFTWLDV